MNNEEQIEISLSKSKMILTFLGSLIFAVLGIWFIINPPKSNHWLFGNPTMVLIAGIASVIFFGIISIIIFRKFSDKKAGLIINQKGIIDNSSGVSAGIIPWSDIEEITIAQVMSQNSYELKREINSDTELKKAYFQAVSNSSWANYGYLVAFEFSDSLSDEMERLNQSFGIGIIELNDNTVYNCLLLP